MCFLGVHFVFVCFGCRKGKGIEGMLMCRLFLSIVSV